MKKILLTSLALGALFLTGCSNKEFEGDLFEGFDISQKTELDIAKEALAGAHNNYTEQLQTERSMQEAVEDAKTAHEKIMEERSFLLPDNESSDIAKKETKEALRKSEENLKRLREQTIPASKEILDGAKREVEIAKANEAAAETESGTVDAKGRNRKTIHKFDFKEHKDGSYSVMPAPTA